VKPGEVSRNFPREERASLAARLANARRQARRGQGPMKLVGGGRPAGAPRHPPGVAGALSLRDLRTWVFGKRAAS
jgi:hypothetical protein